MGYRGYGLPISEVISEGNVGLMQAVKRFGSSQAVDLPDGLWGWRQPRPRRPALLVAGGFLPSRASKLSSFMCRLQSGNYWRKLAGSSGASDSAISGRHSLLFRKLVNSRRPKAIIRISASAGAMPQSLCRPRRSRDCMRTISSWPPKLTAYSRAQHPGANELDLVSALSQSASSGKEALIRPRNVVARLKQHVTSR